MGINPKHGTLYNGQIMVPGTALMDSDNFADVTEVQSPLFPTYYGTDVLMVPNTGLVFDPVLSQNTAKWTVVCTDPLQFQPGPGMGLMSELIGDPNESPTMTSIRMDAVPAIKRMQLWSLIDGDMHLEPLLWNFPGMTRVVLQWQALTPEQQELVQNDKFLMARLNSGQPMSIIEFYKVFGRLPKDHVEVDQQEWSKGPQTGFRIIKDRLHPDQQALVALDSVLSYKERSGEPLTLGEYFKLIGEVVTDKEDFNFIPHCHQLYVEYIPTVQELIGWEVQRARREQQQLGLSRLMPRIFIDHKTGLGMKSPPDAFGLGGNNFYALLKAAYRGLYTDGKRHRGQKVAVVMGTAAEYSLRSLIAELVDLDFFVIMAVPWCGTMGVDSMLSIIYEIVSKYSRKVMPTFDWMDPLQFGPKPSGFDQRAQLVRAQMYEEEFGPRNSTLQKLMRQLQTEYARMTQAGQSTGFAAQRMALTLDEFSFKGKSLFWTMPEIMAYLRKGGE